MSNKLSKIKKQPEKQLKKRVAKHLGMFDLIPDDCKLCKKLFDKKSKEMAQTWVVNANYDSKKVTLFCPDCWNLIQQEKDNLKEKLKNGKRDCNSPDETGSSK